MIFKDLPSFETLLESSERYPEMDVKACAAWMHIVHVGAILKHRVERELNKQGLSYCRFMVLVILSSEINWLPVCTLAKMTCVTSPTISALLAVMEDDGLVIRTNDSSDRRIVRVHITNDGREAIHKIAPSFFRCQSDAMFELDDDGIRSLVLLLSMVNADV